MASSRRDVVLRVPGGKPRPFSLRLAAVFFFFPPPCGEYLRPIGATSHKKKIKKIPAVTKKHTVRGFFVPFSGKPFSNFPYEAGTAFFFI